MSGWAPGQRRRGVSATRRFPGHRVRSPTGALQHAGAQLHPATGVYCFHPAAFTIKSMQATVLSFGLAGEDKIAGVLIGDPSTGYLSCAQGESVVTIHDISLNAAADTTFAVWFQ
jgi:hypothetical protein